MRGNEREKKRGPPSNREVILLTEDATPDSPSNHE